MIRRSFPFVSVGLLVLWLLLNQSISAGHVLLGSVNGLAGAWSLTFMEVPTAHVQRLPAAMRLTAFVVADIVRSNIAVARIVLGSRVARKSGFVEIPLALRSPYGLVTHAVIITSTPGTLWVNFDTSTRKLLIHVLDLT